MKSKQNTIPDNNFIDSIFTYTEQTFKDSLEGSVNITKNNILIPDSLNNTQIKNSFINVDDDSIEEKAAFFSNVKDITKIKMRNTNSIESSAEKHQEHLHHQPIEMETKKIDYKYMSNYRLTEELTRNNNMKEKEYFWFAAYDKLINTKHFKKVLMYYQTSSSSSQSSSNKNKNTEFKEKALIIKDFELTLAPKPFIMRKPGSFIFVKLYYLPIDKINYIFNYINKIEHSLNKELFTFANMTGNNSVIEHNGKQYPYSCLCNLGSFLNVNIYTFTSIYHSNSQKTLDTTHKLIKTYKISRMIKYLMEVFPYYSSDFFIYYFYQNSNCSLMSQDQPIINEQVAQIKAYLKKNGITTTPNPTVKISNFNVNVKLTNNQIIACTETLNSNNNETKKISDNNFNNNNKHNKTACSSLSNSLAKGPMITTNIFKKKNEPKHIAVKSFNVNNHNSNNPINLNKGLSTKLNNTTVSKINNSSTSHSKANISAATVVYRNNVSIQNQISIKRNSIYVVNRKFKADEDFNCEDDSSSINTNRQNETKVYLTPPKKKTSKYYS